MPIVLSQDRELIERSIYTLLREELVAQGFLPDIKLYAGDTAGYNSALEAIKDANGFATEIFGTGSTFKKYQEKVPRIVIRNEATLPGDIGAGPELDFYNNSEDSSLLDIYMLPPQSHDYVINIQSVYKTSKVDRIHQDIIMGILPERGYVQLYNSEDVLAKFFIIFDSALAEPDLEKGIETRDFVFIVKDRWLRTPRLQNEGVAKITQITIDNEIRYSDDRVSDNDDDLVVT